MGLPGTGDRVVLDPLPAARAACDAGVDELVLAPSPERSSADDMRNWLRALDRSVFHPVSVLWDAGLPAAGASLLEAGALRVIVEESAIRDPDLISSLARVVGADHVAVAITAAPRRRDWRVSRAAGSDTEWDAVTWSRVIEAQGGGEIVLKSVDRGRLALDLDLLAEISGAVRIPVTVQLASWGVDDVFDALMIGNADGVAADAPFDAPVAERVRSYLRERGVAARPARAG